MRFSDAKTIKKFMLGLIFYSGTGLCLMMGLTLFLMKPPSEMVHYHEQAANYLHKQYQNNFLKEDSLFIMAKQEQNLLIAALSHTPENLSLWVDLTKAFVKTNQVDRAFQSYKMAKSLGVDQKTLDVAFRVDTKTLRVSSLSNSNE